MNPQAEGRPKILLRLVRPVNSSSSGPQQDDNGRQPGKKEEDGGSDGEGGVKDKGEGVETGEKKGDSAEMEGEGATSDGVDGSPSGINSATMDQEELADQLSLVQQMVLEMKQGFATAMEELSKIQYGDQNLQQQLADNKRECKEEIVGVQTAVTELKTEVQRLSQQLQEVVTTQRDLKTKFEDYQSEKDILLDELEKCGTITADTRLKILHRLSNGETTGQNNNLMNVAPMVHPYLNSLQQHRDEPYHSDSSLRDAVSRSLNLTQALGEKCMQMDMSATSEDEEEEDIRPQHMAPHLSRRKGSSNFDTEARMSQKVPPHEKVMDEIHREESAKAAVEAEREYCSQLWSLIDGYMNQLRQEEIMSNREFNHIFPTYIPQFYEQHCIMLRKMEERMTKWKWNGIIGDVFAKLTDSQDGEGLSLYKRYISDFPAVINGLNKWFSQSSHFRDIMQSSCLGSAPVLPLLLAPLQQVPKYSLLLKNILKFTPVDHPDRYYLESSLTKLKHFLNVMNDDLEHAMQILNINQDGMNRKQNLQSSDSFSSFKSLRSFKTHHSRSGSYRSRESGNSVRSRSSGSSCEANHVSSARDSGIHSNGEEMIKSNIPPETRKYLLEVLRSRREQDPEGHVSTPRGRKHNYGSHPDLTSQLQSLMDGRSSPYMTKQQSKMYSSLSKLPLPSDQQARKERVKKRQDGQKIGSRSNYLRPLTPQIYSSTDSPDRESLDGRVRWREDRAGRSRARPASAVEFTSDSVTKNEKLMEMLAYQASNPQRHSFQDRSGRNELHLSLQKLLAETNGEMQEDSDQEGENDADYQMSYHQQFLEAKEKILRKGSDRDRQKYNESSYLGAKVGKQGKLRTPRKSQQEDYGIYGDDDDDFDEQKLKSMKLLETEHKPKIMIPRWRQNAVQSPPPSYNKSVDMMKGKENGLSEEHIAASLAHSLIDKRKKTKEPVLSSHGPLPSSSWGELRRNRGLTSPINKPGAAKVSVSEIPSSPEDFGKIEQVLQAKDKKAVDGPDKIKSEDIIRNRKKSLSSRESSMDSSEDRNTSVESTPDVKAKDGEAEVLQSQTVNQSERSMSVSSESTALLSDIIAYTADCLEKGSSKASKPPLTLDLNITPPETELKLTDKTDDPHADDLVYYFQNRNKSPPGTSPRDGNQPGFGSVSANSSKPRTNSRSASWASLGKKPMINGMQDQNDAPVRATAVPPPKCPDSMTPSEVKISEADRTSTPIFPTGSVNSEAEKEIDNILSFKPKDQFTSAPERPRATNSVNGPSGGIEIKETRFNKASSSTDTKTVPENVKAQKKPESNWKSLNGNQLVNRSQSPSSYSSGNQPLKLSTFAMPDIDKNKESTAETTSGQVQGIYKKSTALKSPSSKYLGEATARQINKLELSTGTNSGGHHGNTSGHHGNVSGHHGHYEKSMIPTSPTSNVDMSRKRAHDRALSPRRNSPDRPLSPDRGPTGILTPQKGPADLKPVSAKGRTFSPEREKGERPRSVSPIKAKETKIPVRKSDGAHSPNAMSKSTEDISKLKKKSAFKDSIKHLFGRKKKKSNSMSEYKTSSAFDCDPVESTSLHSYGDLNSESSFRYMDEILNSPSMLNRRSNSTSNILQAYRFEDDDDDPISVV